MSTKHKDRTVYNERQKKEIGRRLLQARNEMGWFRKDAADRIGVSERSLASWETGVITPVDKLDKVSEVYGRTKRWFLYGDDQTTAQSDQIIAQLTEIQMELAERHVKLMEEVLEMRRQLDRLSRERGLVPIGE